MCDEQDDDKGMSGFGRFTGTGAILRGLLVVVQRARICRVAVTSLYNAERNQVFIPDPSRPQMDATTAES